MTTVLAIVRPRDGDVDALGARLRALGDHDDVPVATSRAEAHLPGVVAPPGLGEGALTWEYRTSHDPDELLALPAVVDALVGAAIETMVALHPHAARHADTPTPLVKRTLLLRVRADASESARRRFEADLAAMPDHISTIHSWRLSRVANNSAWTHAWEQEYASLDGLTGEYMTHPYHWTTVDAWFDAEVPDHIVEPELAHLFTVRDQPWSPEELGLSSTS